LPDRADLLADLAVNQSGWARFVFKLRSFARWQPIVIALSCAIVFLALLPLLRDGIRQHRLTRKNQKKLHELEQLRVAQNWDGLYKALTEQTVNNDFAKHDSTKYGGIKLDSPEYVSLIQALQQVLFADTKSDTDMLTKKIHLPFASNRISKIQAGIPSL